ncbi:MAG: AAA family ATPase [Gemmatimonadota bacterium]|nr:MAG: AAA family ATPase [Gemmatimonadota bacterium]
MTNPTPVGPRPPRVLLSGRPGCGKTTVIRRAVELIGASRCVGFYTEELRERGRRIGFDVVTVDGRRAPLARAGATGPKVSRYGVDVQGFEDLAVARLEDALRGGVARVLVVDEIGKMELFSKRFCALLERIFEPRAPWALLGTIMTGHHPQADGLKRRPHVSVVEVTRANRDRLPADLSRSFDEYLRRAGA